MPIMSNTGATFASDASKYAVADILSSLARGGVTPTTPPVSIFTSVTTDLLTPNTLTSLEQSLRDMDSSAVDLTKQSGFITPVINPVKREYSDYVFQDESSQDTTDMDWTPPSAKQPRYAAEVSTAPRSTGGRRRKHDINATPEENGRRDVRRERNKVAAAKCRQRRVDITNKLLVESEGLEEDQSKLENEIQMLKAQKEQLVFLLEAHRPNCAVTKVQSPPAPTTVFVTKQVSRKTVVTGSRPSSLAIVPSIPSVVEATGVPITTPSGVFNAFGLESMLDGHTGLTPMIGGYSGLTPIMGAPSGLTPINGVPTSCSIDIKRDPISSDNVVSPTTLLAL